MLRINFVQVVSSLLVIFGSLKISVAYTYDVAVTQFLHENGFSHFESLFSENDVTFDLLQDITEFDLETIGIRSWGVRKKISLAINDLQPSKRARALAEKQPPAKSEKTESGDSKKQPLAKPEKPKLDDFTGIRINKDDAIIQMGKNNDVSLYRSGMKTANFEGSLRITYGVLQFGSSLAKCDAAAAGSVKFSPTSKKLMLCDGNAWSPIGAGTGGSSDGPVAPTYMVGNNGYWCADKGVTLDKDGKSILRWKGAAFDLDPPTGLAPVLALPKSARNSHPKYPAIDFQGKGTALVSTKMHPSGCGDSWTYFVVVKPLVEIGWRNIFTTYDAPVNSVNKACVEGGCTSADPYKYEPWSITEIGVHGWHSPDWHPGKLRMNQLQVVVYSTEKTKGLTINYYENGQAPREYTKKDFNQVGRLCMSHFRCLLRGRLLVA